MPKMGHSQARGRTRQAGMTLLELACAIFVVAVGVLGVIQMFHVGIDKTHALHETNLAVRALRNEIEVLRAAPFDSLADGKEIAFRSTTPEIAKLVNVMTTTTVEPDPSGAAGLKQVTVSIAWTGEHGRTIRKRLVTLIADGEGG